MMMKTFLAAAGAALAVTFTAAPAAAQDDVAADGPASVIAHLYEPDSLTPEQEARLPAAWRIVDLVFAEGVNSESVGFAFFGAFAIPLSELERSPNAALRQVLGYRGSRLGLSASDARAALEVLDPDWEERSALERAGLARLQELMTETLDPLLREAAAEVYAIAYEEDVLRDVEAFFLTESGIAYARRSFSLAHDPRMIVAVGTASSTLFASERVQEEMAPFEQAQAKLMEPRAYEGLSPQELARLSAVTGLGETEIEEAMTFDREAAFVEEAGQAVEAVD